MRCSCPVPLAENTPPKHNVSTSMFDGGDGVLRVIGSIPPPPNTASWVDAKELDFCLIWPHFHPVLLWIIESYMRFLEQGDLAGAAGYQSTRRSVLPIVFLVTVVPTALRSLTRSSHAVLGWFLSILMIIQTPRGEILHGAPDRGRLTVIFCFFHLRIIAPTVVTFSPRFFCYSVSHCSKSAGDQIIFPCVCCVYIYIYTHTHTYTVSSTNIGTLGKYEQRRLWK